MSKSTLLERIRYMGGRVKKNVVELKRDPKIVTHLVSDVTRGRKYQVRSSGKGALAERAKHESERV